MSKVNTVLGQIAGNGGSSAFFYENWLMKELKEGGQKAFMPQARTEEYSTEYCLCFQMSNLRREYCCIEVDFPYIYIRIQQKERGLAALLIRKPVIHIFARHFLIPHNVNMENISFVYKRNSLIIRLPKYYTEIE